jgi:hypothetical protein
MIDDQNKLFVDGKMDEVVGDIMTYILREIRFHISGITSLIKGGER